MITPPALVTQTYYVTQPYSEYLIPPFSYDDPSCLGVEKFQNRVIEANDWITGFTDNLGIGNTVGWQTDDETKVGTYTIEIENYVGCKRELVTY